MTTPQPSPLAAPMVEREAVAEFNNGSWRLRLGSVWMTAPNPSVGPDVVSEESKVRMYAARINAEIKGGVAAYGCDKEARGINNVPGEKPFRCSTWCGLKRCSVSLKSAIAAPAAQAVVGASQKEWQTPPPSWRLLAKAAINLLCAIDEKHDSQKPPLKFSVPYGAVNDLRAALGAAQLTPEADRKGASGEAVAWQVKQKVYLDRGPWVDVDRVTYESAKKFPNRCEVRALVVQVAERQPLRTSLIDAIAKQVWTAPNAASTRIFARAIEHAHDIGTTSTDSGEGKSHG